MPRGPRVNLGGYCYHVLNRANGRAKLFRQPEDYEQFLTILAEAHQRVAMRTVGFCAMPNHWHLLLWPREDGDLSKFMGWLTVTHTQRHHAARGTAGRGHLYQGRFKSFAIQRGRPAAAARSMGVIEGGDPVLSVLRYVERNPVAAGLVARAVEWRWSSYTMRDASEPAVPLCDPPSGLPPDWSDWLNRPQPANELAALQRSLQRGAPFGREAWVRRVARDWGIESTLRPCGRPKLLESSRLKHE